ncbi:preprotein translocase subunit SECY, chloroplastic isoform X1 [Pistacia vera]|uniref:preprotein translocase subunit SECY, chloroplastic isoform X1 n=2 Tax=Pistacia vera TaxID=55513 RepID=UPI0012634946|nr:preprotein translocase subunit SECY, chloroplastic isoform X1 [Pistacia vera]
MFREAAAAAASCTWPLSFNVSSSKKPSSTLRNPICRASFSVQRQPNNATATATSSSNSLSQSCEGSVFDPLGINPDVRSSLNSTWESFMSLLSPTFESTTRKEKSSSARGLAAAIEDSSIDFGDFFKGPLPGKFLKLLGLLALSRLGIYIPLGGVNREAFVGNLDQNSLLGTLDTFSGGGIGRLGICSLGIVPYINAQIVFQLLAQIYPKLQDLQKREGEAGRKKVKQYTQYASVGFAVVQAVGQVLFLRPYVNDFSTQWVLTSVTLLTLGSVLTTYLGEKISDLKLGNGTSLLIFTNIISYLPASFGRTVAQAYQDGNYVGLVAILISFFLLVLGIVYVQEAERKIPLNYASRYSSRSGGLQRSAYLPFKVNSSGVMPIIFSTSSLALPGTLARFTGIAALKKAALALNPGGSFYLPTNIVLIAFFNYYYTFLQLDPDDLSEQLKRQGASIPLVRPGKSTAAFIQTVLSRISVLGSVFLAILAAGPSVIEQTTHLTAFRGFAGTSVLILVGCATDTARKVQAEIISQKYKNIEFYDIDRYGS